MICVETQRSHSLMISTFASLYFIVAHSRPRQPWALSDRAGRRRKVLTPPRVNAPCRAHYNKVLNEYSLIIGRRPQKAAPVLSFPLRTVQILTRTQPSFPAQHG